MTTRIDVAGRLCERREENPLPEACTIEIGVRQAPPEAGSVDLDVVLRFGEQPIADGGVSYVIGLGFASSAEAPGQVVLKLDGRGFDIVRGTEYARDVPPPAPIVERREIRTKADAATRVARKRRGAARGKGKVAANLVGIAKSALGLGGSDTGFHAAAEGEIAGAAENNKDERAASGQLVKTVFTQEVTIPPTSYIGDGRWRCAEPRPGRVLGGNYLDANAEHGLCAIVLGDGDLTVTATCVVHPCHVRVQAMTIDGQVVGGDSETKARILELLAGRVLSRDGDGRLAVARASLRAESDDA
jgi:hypothetical protein